MQRAKRLEHCEETNSSYRPILRVIHIRISVQIVQQCPADNKLCRLIFYDFLCGNECELVYVDVLEDKEAELRRSCNYLITCALRNGWH